MNDDNNPGAAAPHLDPTLSRALDLVALADAAVPTDEPGRETVVAALAVVMALDVAARRIASVIESVAP